MKSVRFSNVVKKSGKPEVYLLLSKDDAEFKKALKANRIMTLIGAEHGSTGYGTVGYDTKHRGQILLFPKSLKSFEGTRVVGIKYDLLSGEDAPAKKAPPVSKKPEREHVAKKMKPAAKPEPAKPREPKSKKVIPFPKQKPERYVTVAEIKGYVRQAIRALEKNNSVAAYKLLKRIE